MAFVLTYDTLTATVKNYVERNDATLIASIPTFIMLGERRCARDLKILGLKVAITDNFIPGQAVFAKPTRWLNDCSFNIGTGTNNNSRKFLLQRAYEVGRQYWPDPTQTGEPKYYSSDYNYNYWIVFPTPEVAYPYEIIYYETPQLIDDTISTNFLTGSIPEALMYATLLETATYLKDDERIGAWTNYYEKAKKNILDEDLKRIYDSYSKRGG